MSTPPKGGTVPASVNVLIMDLFTSAGLVNVGLRLPVL